MSESSPETLVLRAEIVRLQERLAALESKSDGSLSRAQESLLESEELNRRIIEAVPAAIVHVASDGRVLRANAEAMQVLGMTQEDLEQSRTLDFETKTIFEDGTPCTLEAYPVTQALVTGMPQPPVTIGAERPDGTFGWAVYTAVPVRSASGEVTGSVVTFLDITARKQMEKERARIENELMQAQKLESLGLLAGGIAHDFNNLLLAVVGNVGLARMQVTPGSDIDERLADIDEAARRASDLTRQMLAYAGKGEIQRKPVNLSVLSQEVHDLLRLSIPERIRLQIDFADDLPNFDGDPSQIHQVVMNLVRNASEAHGEEGGEILVRTSTIEIDADGELDGLGIGDPIPAGRYVTLSVSDRGVGIDPEVLPRIFEPFFSTKRQGRGLGLSAVLGIVRRHQGTLRIKSALGDGTSMQVLFPASDTHSNQTTGAERSSRSSSIPGPTAAVRTVLVADDEEIVRNLVKRTLETLGYRVILAVDGKDALDKAIQQGSDIDCAILDVVMPRAGGVETMVALRSRWPGLAVVLSSGYTKEAAMFCENHEGPSAFLGKPYGPEQLAATLAHVLRTQRSENAAL